MGVQPKYFLDEMEGYEVNAIITQYNNQYELDWERTRRIMHSVVQVQCTKSLNLEQVIKFPWDGEDEIVTNTQASTKEAYNFVKEMQDKLNAGNK